MPCYRRCPLCGAALDPGERCDCQDKETAPGATNSGDCQEVMEKARRFIRENAAGDAGSKQRQVIG